MAERRVVSRQRVDVPRVALLAALVAAVVVVAVLLLGGGGSAYTVHAQFVDGGQLVKGNLVQSGGQPIGTISEITLSDDGLADVEMKIDEERFSPLHRGTRAKLRSPGLGGVAARYVDLNPGPEGAPEIDDGGVIEVQDTEPIVDLDALLNALDPAVRDDIQSIITDGSKLAEGDNPADLNRALGYLNPATAQVRALTSEIVRDQAAVSQLITSSATVVDALASRSTDVEQGIANTAGTFQAIASERDALESTLRRAPGVLTRARATLAGVRSTVAVARPALREARPVSPRLARFLRDFVPTARRIEPLIPRIRATLPPLRRVLEQAPALARVGLPAVRSLTTAARPLLPILGDLRPYAPDLALGLFGGLGGSTAGSFDANGHFARISPHFAPQALGSSALGSLLPGIQLPGLSGLRTGLTARCPGAAVEPAEDGSNPYLPDGVKCDREHGK